MQYTIRQVPKSVDAALRAKAKFLGKSLNQTTVDVLREALKVNTSPRHDLSDLIGTMTADDARVIEKSVSRSDKADLKSQRTA